MYADINECLLRNGHGPCQDTCYNTLGSYQCSCDGLPGTKLINDHFCISDTVNCIKEVDGVGGDGSEGRCSHNCISSMGQTFCLCPDGYILGNDWKTCQGILL